MRLAAAQTLPIVGDIDHNLAQHHALIGLAAAQQADLLVFPELSLTGYAPSRAAALALSPADPRLEDLQAASRAHRMVLAVGAPLWGAAGLHIGLWIFDPDGTRRTYAKRSLHADEHPFFVPGREPVVLRIGGEVVVPAICYESLLPENAAEAAALGATVYLASVAKSAAGLQRAGRHYPEVARRHRMVVLMASSIGTAEGFLGAGQSAVWGTDGGLVGALEGARTGVVLYDTETKAAQVRVSS